MVPQSSDQPLVAARAQQLNLGRKLSLETITPSQLLESAEDILADPMMQESVKAMQSILHHSGGNSRGADVIQQYFATNKQERKAVSPSK
ncbi:hypothetical protein D3C77_495260 [compost metagenome]